MIDRKKMERALFKTVAEYETLIACKPETLEDTMKISSLKKFKESIGTALKEIERRNTNEGRNYKNS